MGHEMLPIRSLQRQLFHLLYLLSATQVPGARVVTQLPILLRLPIVPALAILWMGQVCPQELQLIHPPAQLHILPVLLDHLLLPLQHRVVTVRPPLLIQPIVQIRLVILHFLQV